MKKIFFKFRQNWSQAKTVSFQTTKVLQNILKFTLIGMTLKYMDKTPLSFSEKPYDEEIFIEEQENPNEIKVLELYFDEPEFQLATPSKITLPSRELHKSVTFLVHHADQPFRAATGSLCTYDNKTDLSEGLLINNKLVCPEHGCEFNIFTGQVEHGPAINDLPIYNLEKFSEKTNLEKSKLKVYMPLLSPIALRPVLSKKHPNDFRKVIIIGCGASAIGASETLRKNAFTGDILVMCDSDYGPIQRRNLSKFTKFAGNENFLNLRDKEFFKEADIDILTKSPVKKMTLMDDYGYLQLVNNAKYYFDALLIASGSKKATSNFALSTYSNYVNLSDMKNFRKSEQLLKKSKVVALGGVTFESLELASSILRDFPSIKIHLFSFVKPDHVETDLGKQVYKSLIEGLKKRGVKFHDETKFNQTVLDAENKKITEIKYGPSENRIKSIKPDIFYDFPFDCFARTEFVDPVKYKDLLGKNKSTQMQVNSAQRTRLRFIFSTGAASATSDFSSQTDIKFPSFADSYYQGEISAYNMLALKMPNSRPSFNYYHILGKTFQNLVTKNNYDEVFTEGDLKELDFISYFLKEDHIVSVTGTNKFAREMMLLKEAIKSGRIMHINGIKNDRVDFYSRLTETLANDPSIRCIRGIIFNKKYNFIPKEVFWKDSSTTKDVRSEEFVNFKPLGK